MKDLKADSRFQFQIFFVNSLIPFLLMVWDWSQDKLGANPTEFLTRATGVLTLVFLLLTLTVTPVRKYFVQPWLIKHRRLLGLFSFFYGSLHLLTYIFFDRNWALESVPSDIAKRPFIAIGMLSFFLMVPLAITSTNNMIRKLGAKNWNRLHKLTYFIAIGGVIHFAMIVKSDLTFPLIFGSALVLLLLYRIKEFKT